MKIAVLSDIHGNYVALERCVAYSKSVGVELFVFLGDYLGDLGYPQRTMDIIYRLKEEYDCLFIKGNKEEYWINYLLNGEQGWNVHDSTTGSLRYTYDHLTEKDMTFFQELPCVDNINIMGYPTITICHGSPNKTREDMLPNNENTFAIMEQNENALIVCGHTHVQQKIEHKGKVVLNPGSVGMPLQAKGKAQFMILTGENNTWKHTFINQVYEVDQVIADLHESGLYKKAPGWCEVSIHVLMGGEITHTSVLVKAMALCQQDMGECIWPDIPERYWEKAVEELIYTCANAQR